MVQGLFKGKAYFVQVKPDNRYGNNSKAEEFKEIWYMYISMYGHNLSLIIHQHVHFPSHLATVYCFLSKFNRNQDQNASTPKPKSCHETNNLPSPCVSGIRVNVSENPGDSKRYTSICKPKGM